jgi:hypothetical protein
VAFGLVFVLALLAGLSSAAAQPTLSRFAPDDTLLYLEARDLTALREEWQRTPFERMWKDPAFAVFFKPIRQKLDRWVASEEKDWGLTLEDARQIFPSEVAIFLSEMRFETSGSGSFYEETNTGFMARYKGSTEKLRALIESHVLGDAPADAERSVTTFKDVRIYTTIYRVRMPGAPLPDMGGRQANLSADTSLPIPLASGTSEYHYEYAFVDDLCIVLEGQRAFMKKVLANYFAVKEGRQAPASLWESGGLSQASSPKTAQPDLLGYANLQTLVQRYLNHPDYAHYRNLTSLGLEDLISATAAVRLRPEALDVDVRLTTRPAPQGVVSLLVGDTRNEFRSQRLVPADAQSYTSCVLDFPRAYRLGRDIAAQINPGALAGFESVERQVEQRSGVRLQEDLVQRLSGEIALYSRQADPGESGTAPSPSLAPRSRTGILLELTREDGVADALARLVRGMVLGGEAPWTLQSDNYQGVAVYSFKPKTPSVRRGPPPPPPTWSFATTNSFLIVASDVEEVRRIVRSARGGSADGLPRNAAFARATAGLRPGYSGLVWCDLHQAVQGLADRFTAAAPLLLPLVGALNPTALPSPDTASRYLGQFVGASYGARDTLTWTATLQYPAGSGRDDASRKEPRP